MTTKRPGAKYACFGFFAGLLVAAVFAYAYWLPTMHTPTHTPTQVGGIPAPLPDISTPKGWHIDEKTPSQIIFTRSDSKGLPYVIQIDASTIRGTLEQTIAASRAIPFHTASSTYIGWSGIPMSYVGEGSVPMGWAIINGNLILVSNDPQTDTETSLDYSIYHNGIMYSFSAPYQSYYLPANTFKTISMENLSILQGMVEDFSNSLPSGIYQ